MTELLAAAAVVPTAGALICAGYSCAWPMADKVRSWFRYRAQRHLIDAALSNHPGISLHDLAQLIAAHGHAWVHPNHAPAHGPPHIATSTQPPAGVVDLTAAPTRPHS